VKEYVFEPARFPLGQLGEEYRRFQLTRGYRDDPGTLLPIADSADHITIIVAGGVGKHFVLATNVRPPDQTRAPGDCPVRRHADQARG
jgi:hypothetical protein